MATEITTLTNYENINKIDFGEKVIFFKFGGEWCVPCKELEKTWNVFLIYFYITFL